MKKAVLTILLSVAVLSCGAALYAQTDAGQAGGGPAHHMPMSTDDRLQHLTQMLDLTSDQQQKIRPILENESQQMQALHQDSSMTREDRMTKMRSIRENTSSQIAPLLTSDQQKKWQQMRMRHMSAPPPNAVGPGGEQPAPPQQ